MKCHERVKCNEGEGGQEKGLSAGVASRGTKGFVVCASGFQLLIDGPCDPQDCPEGEQYDTLYCSLLAELKAAYPGHLPLLQEHLKKVRGGGGALGEEKRSYKRSGGGVGMRSYARSMEGAPEQGEGRAGC